MIDFFVLGVPKAGTTTFAKLLSSHPRIHTGRLKEPRFFDLNYQQGLPYLAEMMGTIRPEQLCGDCSPGYFHCPWVADRIRKHCPKAKLLVVLREPVARAYSNWWSKRSRGLETKSFEECAKIWLNQREQGVFPLHFDDAEELYRKYLLSKDTNSVPYVYYFDIGLYASHLERYEGIFPSTRIKVFSFQALIRETDTLLKECANFLEIDPYSFSADRSAKNQSLGPQAARLREWAQRCGLTKSVPLSIQKTIRHIFRRMGDGPPPLSPTLKRRLQESYDPHNLKLKALLGHLPWESPFLLQTDPPRASARGPGESGRTTT